MRERNRYRYVKAGDGPVNGRNQTTRYAVYRRSDGLLLGWIARGDGGAGPMGRRGPRGLGYGRGYWVFMTTTKPLDRIGRFDTRHAAADYLEDVAIPKAAWLGPPVTLA